MNWAQGIVTLHPGSVALIADVDPIFKCHLFLGMTIFLVFPFTRLVHVWSVPVWYFGRTGYQVVRTMRPMARRIRIRPPVPAVAAINAVRRPPAGALPQPSPGDD